MAKNNHKGDENLIPFNQRTKEELREITRRGGINSGIARRRQKTASEYMEMILALPLSVTQAKYKATLETMGLQEDDIDQLSLMVTSMLRKAQAGDVNAMKMVLMLRGQMPAEKQEITGAEGTPLVANRFYDVSNIPHDELMALTKAAFAQEDKGTEEK